MVKLKRIAILLLIFGAYAWVMGLQPAYLGSSELLLNLATSQSIQPMLNYGYVADSSTVLLQVGDYFYGVTFSGEPIIQIPFLRNTIVVGGFVGYFIRLLVL